MFKAVIGAGLLKTLVKAMSNTVDEAKWNLSESGINIRFVDAASVAMTLVDIPCAAFSYFKADTATLGVDITKMKDMISDADDSSNVTLELMEEKSAMRIGFGNYKLDIALIDPTALRPEPRIPDFDLPTEVSMSGPEFRKIVSSAMKISDHVFLGVHDQAFFASSKDVGQAFEANIPSNELLAFRDGESRSLFSLDYLDDMSKAAAKAEQVTLELGVDYPTRIKFSLTDSTAKPSITYIVAPRIETD